MRDGGFEFNYQGEWYIAKQGFVLPFKNGDILNELSDENGMHTVTATGANGCI
jgi:hypothetical protein